MSHKPAESPEKDFAFQSPFILKIEFNASFSLDLSAKKTYDSGS
jgi:hypothetical protein